jgi:hypothetical protein
MIENSLSIAALVSGMVKENSKISYMFFHEIHSLRTNSNSSDHLSKVGYFLFRSSILVVLIFAI